MTEPLILHLTDELGTGRAPSTLHWSVGGTVGPA